MNDSFALRQFDLAEADWKFQADQLSVPRRQVFIVEQDLTAHQVFDGQDERAWHWLATSNTGRPIGSARLLPDGEFGQMAVLPDFRNRGIGTALLETIITKATKLGMTRLAANVPADMEEFYTAKGFQSEGEHSLPDGALGIRMVRQLDNGTGTGKVLAEHLRLKQFDTREAYWQEDSAALIRIRNEVFVKGQSVPLEIEQDGRDDTAYHWLARDLDGLAVGTGRLLPDGHIGRMAVLESQRGQGVGFTILELAVQKARYLGMNEVSLNAQTYAQGFYEKAGFTARGEEFMEAGIPHIEMYLVLQPEEDVHRQIPFDNLTRTMTGDYQGDGAAPEYILGKTSHPVILRSESEFRNISCDLADQARFSLKIWSPLLDHRLYDTVQFGEVVSRLARRNKRTEIQILLYDSHRVVKNGHVLLELARRLSSSIQLRIVHPDYRQMNHEYLVADDFGIIYRLDYEIYEGYTNYYDKTEGNRLRREFARAWETGLYDPNLRQLKI